MSFEITFVYPYMTNYKLFYPSNENNAAIKTNLIYIYIERSQGDIKKTACLYLLYTQYLWNDIEEAAYSGSIREGVT